MKFSDLKMEDYPSFLKLYNSSFPDNERRIYEDERHLSDFIESKDGKFHAFAAKDGDFFIGFLSYWTFDSYTYIEHFAVAPEMRGKNIGTSMLGHLFKVASPEVIIEVEPPTSPDAKRRIKFYERNGFQLRSDFDYTQPPYGPGQKPVKMAIMTHGNVNLNGMRSIKEILEEVYNVECGE